MGFPVNIQGNLTADLEVRYIQSGTPVASGTVAVNERKLNRQTNEWEDGEATFIRISIWRELGEHAAASLHKGDRVVVSGKVDQRSYEDKEGVTRQSLEMTVDDIGPSLKYATAQVTRAQRQQQGQQGGGYNTGVVPPYAGGSPVPPPPGYGQQYPGAQQGAPAGAPQQRPWGQPNPNDWTQPQAAAYGNDEPF